ncbi:LLM class flavin-dependent oxidoreductase, partial [Actinomadura rubrisoli]
MSLPLLFGANIDPIWKDAEAPLRQALAAENLGLDLITIQDHPYQAAFHDTWTLLTYLAARTERITFVPTVASLPLRPPAMLAKSAASLHLLTGGRLQLGLGAGAFWDAIVAMGGPRRTPGQAVDALTEAIDVIRAMWSGERAVRTNGTTYRLAGVHPGPAPG